MKTEDLQALCKQVRRDIISSITAAKSGHPGGCLSAAEMMAGMPPVRQPTTTTSVSMVSVIRDSSIWGASPSQLGPAGACVVGFLISSVLT